MAKPKRTKKQISFQLTPDVAGWVCEIERKTGATRGRIGIAAILAYILQTKETQELCMHVATGIDLKELTLDEVLANVLLINPGKLAPVGSVQEYLMRYEFPPDGEIPQEYIDASLAAARRDPQEKEIDAAVDAWIQEELLLARKRAEAAEARLRTAGKLAESGGGQKKPKRKGKGDDR